MGEFVAPGGRYSGRRYAVLTAQEYKDIGKTRLIGLEGPVNLAYVNERNCNDVVAMRALIDELKRIRKAIIEKGRIDTLTLVTYQPILYTWLTASVMNGTLDHLIVITNTIAPFDIVEVMPQTDILFKVQTVEMMMAISKMPIKANIICGVLVNWEKVHWALGALRGSGRPDICVYVDLSTITPDPRGASV